jgi:hypothetical protein
VGQVGVDHGRQTLPRSSRQRELKSAGRREKVGAIWQRCLLGVLLGAVVDECTACACCWVVRRAVASLSMCDRPACTVDNGTLAQRPLTPGEFDSMVRRRGRQQWHRRQRVERRRRRASVQRCCTASVEHKVVMRRNGDGARGQGGAPKRPNDGVLRPALWWATTMGWVRICGSANCCKANVSVRIATPSKRDWTKGACNGDR